MTTVVRVRQLLQRSVAAYRAAPGIRGKGRLALASEPTSPNTNISTISYVLGLGTDASVLIDGYGCTTLGDRAYLSRSDRPGIYVVAALMRDLPTTMKSAFGAAMFVPPQLVMRAGYEVDAIIQAMGFGLITGLVSVGTQSSHAEVGRPTEEIEFRGQQGTVVARFAADTAFLLDVTVLIGDTRCSCAFDEETIVRPEGAVQFDAKGRNEVNSFDDGMTKPAMVGAPAPDFTLGALDGSTRSLVNASGSPLVIDFWALWCGPCVQAMPRLDALAKRMAAATKPIGLWTVALVETRDEATILERIRDMWTVKGLALPVLIDRDGRVSERYGIKALPTTVVVDERGVVRFIEVGLNPDKLAKLINFG